jgi:hypothetical protein
MFCDAAKYGVAREERGIEIECALGYVSIGEGDVDSVAAKVAPKAPEINPVRERRPMNRRVLQKLPDQRAGTQVVRSAQNLRNYEGWKEQRLVTDHRVKLVETA